jgi:hypothetical protein
MGSGEEHQLSRNPKDKNGKSTTSGENSGKTANPGINGKSTTSGENLGKDANSKDLSGSKYWQERNGNNERSNSGNKDFPCNNGERDKWTPYMGNQTSDDPILNSKNPAQSTTSLVVEATNKAMNDGPNSVGLESTKESPCFSFTGPLISEVEKRMKINSQDSELKTKGKEGITWKRKAQGIAETEGPRKKRDGRGDDYSSSLGSKGRKESEHIVNQSGSGMAAAVVQPHRPQ